MLVCCSSQGANNKQCTTQAAHRHWRFLAAPAPRFQAAELPGSHLLTPSFLSEQMETQEQEPRARRGHLCLSYSNYWSCNCRVVTHTQTHTQCLLSLHCWTALPEIISPLLNTFTNRDFHQKWPWSVTAFVGISTQHWGKTTGRAENCGFQTRIL